MANAPFQLTRARAWLVGLIVAALGVLSIVAADLWFNGTFEATAKSVGATVFSIGLVTIAYDVFIRKSYTEELLEVVGLSAHLSASGVKKIEQETGLDWASILDDGSEFTLLLIDGSVFAEREWPRVLAASRRRKTHVRVYILDPRSGAVAHVAEHLGRDQEEFVGTLRRTQETLENSWANARHSDPSLHSESKLELFTYDSIAPYSIVFVDEAAIVSLTPSTGKVPGQGPIAIQVDLRDSDALGPWLEEQRVRLHGIVDAPSYSEPPK